MTATLPREDFADLVQTVFLRPRNPDDHREFERLLPWFTPLFVYAMDGDDYVRWHVPTAIGEKMGLDRSGCACCGEKTVIETDTGYHVDTAVVETDWWLTTNGYALPGVAVRNTTTPQEGEVK